MIPPDLGKPRVTEIQVRMDCNGCVQKIKKALHGINGIYDLYIDFPQQKLTIIGWADPEKIIKAVKKARRTAIICSHSEQPADPPTAPQPETTPNQPTEPEAAKPPEQAPAPDGKTPPPPPPPPPPPAEAQASGAAPPAEPPKDPPPPPTENPPPDVKPSAVANDTSARQPAQPSGKKGVEEVRVTYYYPPDYGYRYNYGESYSHSYGGGQCNDNKNGPKNRLEPSPHAYATHSYNTQKPSASVAHSYITSNQAPYVREYEYIRSPPQHTKYSTPERQSDDCQNSYSGKGNITSMFSEENPNACTIV